MSSFLIFSTFLLLFITAAGAQNDTGDLPLGVDAIGQWSEEFLLHYQVETGQKFSLVDQNVENNVQFFLYTRNNPNYTVLGPGNSSEEVLKSGFNPYKETKVLIHGWLSSADSEFCSNTKEAANIILAAGSIFFRKCTVNCKKQRVSIKAYLNKADCNVIIVEWADLAMNTVYLFARMSVESVGNHVATFLDFLVIDVDLDLRKLHVIGHSLGAHIAGVCGQNMLSGALTRITGLDPASILFSTDPSGSLDQSDAHFVDVIHTSGLYIGYITPIGHVDFYPNGGIPVQPGCGLDIGTCTHSRAHTYFIESIHSDDFIGVQCDTWSHFKKGQCDRNNVEIMGEHVSLSARGTYFLKTASTSPYALGMGGTN